MQQGQRQEQQRGAATLREVHCARAQGDLALAWFICYIMRHVVVWQVFGSDAVDAGDVAAALRDVGVVLDSRCSSSDCAVFHAL